MRDAETVRATGRRLPIRRLAFIALALVVVAGRYYVVQLAPRLRPLSLRGVEGLVRYTLGDYVGAAVAYRGDLRDRFATGGLRVDDEEFSVVAGDREHARALANAALERDPGVGRSLLTQVEVALDEDDARGAVTWAERALRVGPTDVDALLLATVAYSRAGDHERGLQSLKAELRAWAPERRLTTFLRVLAETGRLAGLPVHDRPSCLLAHLHRYLRIDDDFQARPALARAEEAIAKGDGIDDAYVTIGVIHQKQTDDDAALAAFLHAIDANPRNADAYRWAAEIYADRGDLVNEYRMARAAYENARHVPAYALIFAHVMMQKFGDYRAALEIENEVLASGAENPVLLEDIGYLHAVLGHGEEAQQSYRRAAALAPADPIPMRGLGWAFQMQQRYDDAISAYRKAVALAPQWLDAHLSLGLAYRDAGRYEEAAAELEPVFRLDATERWYLPTLCITYQLAGRLEDARGCARRFVAMTGDPDMAFLTSFTVLPAGDGPGR